MTNPLTRSVNIRPKVTVLSVLAHLEYKPWYALAEFVDNSIQSFEESRTQLEALEGPGFSPRVSIEVDPGLRRIKITDNAGGIRAEDFPRAFRPAEIPPNRSGLSEFGMGMKTAACWFAPLWRVTTSVIGEPIQRWNRTQARNPKPRGSKLKYMLPEVPHFALAIPFKLTFRVGKMA